MKELERLTYTDFQELGRKKYKSGLHNLDMLAEVAVKELESRKKEKGKDVLEIHLKDQYSPSMWQWHTRNQISRQRSSLIISEKEKGCHGCPMINTQRALIISDDQTCPNLHDSGTKLDDEGIFLESPKVNNLSGKKRRFRAVNSPESVKQLAIKEPNKAKLDVNLSQSESEEMPESSRRIRDRQGTSSVSQSQSETSVEMPESIRRIRERQGVSSVNKLIEKQLFKTDVAANNGRLSIPLSQVSTEFLTQGEKERLDTKVGTKWAALEVDLIEPSDSVKNIEIRKWCFRGASSIYVLTKRWMEVVKNNALQAGDRIQVWWFREANDLKLVLIILSRAGHIQNP